MDIDVNFNILQHLVDIKSFGDMSMTFPTKLPAHQIFQLENVGCLVKDDYFY